MEVKGKNRSRSKELAVIPRHYDRTGESKITKQKDDVTYKEWVCLVGTSWTYAGNFSIEHIR